MNIIILALESSCDETAAAIAMNGKILANVIATQDVHQKYGGIVPELASRAHQQNIVPVVNQALSMANITKFDLNAVAFTQGPGLLGALLVGVTFGKALAFGLNLPFIGVNHMQAHILAHFIDEPKPEFPFLCLTISGGHTQIVMVKSYLDMEIMGETQDDAVGEAFDKTAKLLNLPYPGGPLIDKYSLNGNGQKYAFPQVETPGYNFSFSGIKTAFRNFILKNSEKDPDFIQNNLPDICASIQYTLVNILFRKLIAAANETGISNIAIAGGVAANTEIRNRLEETSHKLGWNVFIPKFEYCTDNAAMIAITAHYKFLHNEFGSIDMQPDPRMKLGTNFN